MNIKYLKSAIASLILTISGFANAGLIFDATDTTLVTGATGFTVGGIDYSLILTEGTCATVYGDCTVTSTFTLDSTTLAALYLNFAQMVNSEAGPDARLYGLSGNGWRFAITPHQKIVNDWVNGAYGIIKFNNTQIDYTRNTISTSGMIDTSTREDMVWGVWSVAPKEVPEPSTLLIFALGIMGLASRRFKKKS